MDPCCCHRGRIDDMIELRRAITGRRRGLRANGVRGRQLGERR